MTIRAAITHDTMARGVPGRLPVVGGRSPVKPTPVHLNVHLMLASSFDPENYLESLKILSHAAQFFQVNPVFDRLNAPDMDRSIEQLTLEIGNLGMRPANSGASSAAATCLRCNTGCAR